MLQGVQPAKLKSTVGLLKSLAVGVAAFLLGVAADQLSRVLHGPFGILDDIVLATLSGLIVLWYERLRTRDLRQRLIMARQINHQVRDELQTVVVSAAAQKKDEYLGAIVRRAMERIDGALKEVLTETGSLARK